MQEKANILIVDDEVEVLHALKRLFRRRYHVDMTTEPEKAVDMLNERRYAAVISDMRMPKLSGDKLLEHAYNIAPQTPRLLLTGYSDVASAEAAVNVGKISHFISKPWDNQELTKIVDSSIEQYLKDLTEQWQQTEMQQQNYALKVRSEKLKSQVDHDKCVMTKLHQRLEKKNNDTRTLFHDVVELLTKMSEVSSGDDEGHAKRVALHSRLLAKQMDLPAATISRCYLSGLVHELGKMSLPCELIRSNESDLEKGELMRRQKHVEIAADIVATIPALSPLANIVRHQYERFDGTGFPDKLIGSNIPIEARVLAVVNEYDKLLIGRTTGKKMMPKQARQIMQKNKAHFDAEILQAYFHLLANHQFSAQSELDICVSTSELEPGMSLSRDLKGNGQVILLTKKTVLSQKQIEKLQKYEKEWDVILNIFVH